MKKFKIGVMNDSFRKDLNEGIKCAALVRAEGIQLYAVSGKTDPDNMTDEKISYVLDLLRKNNLEISAICGDLGGHGFKDKNDNPNKIVKTKRILELAKKMGVKVVTTHVGCIPEDKDDDVYKVMKKAVCEICEYADSLGVYFAIETGPETSNVLADFIRDVGKESLKVNFDPANLVMVQGEDPVKAVYNLAPYIVHTHAKDGVLIKKDPATLYDIFAGINPMHFEASDYFIDTPLGEGNVDFDKYLNALSDIGYSGYLTIEREAGEDPFADISKAVEFLEKKIGN